MTHPDELLADYVDGTLGPDERAEVDVHLAGCERCRADLRSATRARSELRGVASVDAPPRLRERILSAAEEPRPAARSSSGTDAWPPLGSLDAARRRRARPVVQWLAAAAAALIVAVLAFVAVPNLLSGGSADSTGSAAPAAPELGGTAASGGGSNSGLVLQPDHNYGAASIHQLAAAAAAGRAPVPTDTATTSEAQAAVACLTKGAELKGTEQPVELIGAKFEGKPAYLGVYRLPASGNTPERVVVWVVSKTECSVVSFSQALIR
jgi:predicted anti-sigma-YlaC factor YlaD